MEYLSAPTTTNFTRFIAVLSSIIISFCILLPARSQNMAYWQNSAEMFNQGQVQPLLDGWSAALDRYYAKHQSLPSSTNQIDQFLLDNYQSVHFGVGIPSHITVQPKQQSRTLAGIAMWIDPQVSNLTKINNQWKFPENWQSPENIACVTDGNNNYVVFYAPRGQMSAMFRVGQKAPASHDKASSSAITPPTVIDDPFPNFGIASDPDSILSDQ